jgi:hypothetical protein
MAEEYKQVSVTLDPDAYLCLNSIVKERRGKTLEELAVADPYAAYQALRIGKLIYSQLYMSLVAQKRDMSPEDLDEAKILQRLVVEQIMPDPPTQQSEITVSVWDYFEPGTPLDSQVMERERRAILSFVVGPSNSE